MSTRVPVTRPCAAQAPSHTRPTTTCRAQAVLQVLSGYRSSLLVQQPDEDTDHQLLERARVANFFVSQELHDNPTEGAVLELLEGKWDVNKGSLGEQTDYDGAAAPEWPPEMQELRIKNREHGKSRREALLEALALGHDAYFDRLLDRPPRVNEV
jgi:hypothetical protein